MILVDSSIWVSAERGRVDVTRLRPLRELAVCPAIVHELLRGVTKRSQSEYVRNVVYNTLMVDSPTPLQRFEEAADLYSRCRAAGFTATGFDCLIAASAIANDVPLLHDDDDFERLARVDHRLKLRRP